MSNTITEFQTNKKNVNDSRIANVPVPPPLENGEILLKIDSFAYTANNISYGVLGEKIRYWDFFPAQGDNKEQWGLIPVWGFADVIESKSSSIAIGERLYGYFPPSSLLKMKPTGVEESLLIDDSPHRSHLPPVYNMYRRVLAEPNYDRANDNFRMLLFPLHVTSFALHDLLESNEWFGAEQIVIVSASSKTSTGLAYGLQADPNAPPVIGLTSPRNSELLGSLKIYDHVLSYQQINSINASTPTVIVDMSADSNILSKLHTHLADNMRFCSNVGLTHWDQPQVAEGIITERSKMFFAPSHINRRLTEWGQDLFDQKSRQFFAETTTKSSRWLKIHELEGTEGLASVYSDVCQGKLAADAGIIIKM